MLPASEERVDKGRLDGALDEHQQTSQQSPSRSRRPTVAVRLFPAPKGTRPPERTRQRRRSRTIDPKSAEARAGLASIRASQSFLLFSVRAPKGEPHMFAGPGSSRCPTSTKSGPRIFLRVHDAVPAPTPPQRHANASRNQGAQCAPVPVIEEIHLVVLNPERFKKLRRLLRAVDPPAIGVVRAVRIATQPCLVGHSPVLPVQLLVALEFFTRESHPMKHGNCPRH